MTKFDKTPAKQINQVLLTGRAGIRKGTKVVEISYIVGYVKSKPIHKTRWFAVDSNTVFYEDVPFYIWGSQQPYPERPEIDVWKEVKLPVKEEEIVGPQLPEQERAPVGTKYTFIRKCPSFEAIVGVVYPDKAYGPSAVKR